MLTFSFLKSDFIMLHNADSNTNFHRNFQDNI